MKNGRGSGRVVGERERVSNLLLWLIGIVGLVTREQLLRLLNANPRSCSTIDRALAHLSGAFTGHRRGRFGAWQEVRPGLQCPACGMGTVAAVLVKGRGDDGIRVAYGHGAPGSAPDELVACTTRVDHVRAAAVRRHLDRYLRQPLPPALIERRPGRLDGDSYLRLTDAGRERLAALRRDGGQAPIPLPCWTADDYRSAEAHLAYSEFAVEFLAATGYAESPWTLPIRISSPGPQLVWASGDEDGALAGDPARAPRSLSVHTELMLPSRRLWLMPAAWVMSADQWRRQDHRLVKAIDDLLGRLHRPPAPGRPSVYRRTYGDGVEARGILLVPEPDRERLSAYVDALPPPPWPFDSFGFIVQSPTSLVDYVCRHLNLVRRGRQAALSEGPVAPGVGEPPGIGAAR